ncbi:MULTISPECIES: glycosyltransferase [Sphingobacterium]|uniref:Glycosyltransferase n=1 Tax=Sphingobacterium populi TaxID=1812824 RepID=A0ABW5UAZ0_9SPHI|nr:glycosyltransferase [Sphingobacterium sp. CFCC 11742]
MITPKISVVVPIYNVEKYLDRCMQSLQNQTLKDIEIILVDDESPDNCPKMCDEYASQDPRVKVIHKKNAGLGFARNSGLSSATGEFVIFVDSDDWIDTTALSIMYNEAIKNNVDTVFCNHDLETNSGNFDTVHEIKENRLLTSKNEIAQYLLNMIGAPASEANDRLYSMSVWHALYSVDVIKKANILFFSEREFLSEDVLFHVQYLYYSQRVSLLDASFYKYCLNETSLTKTYRSDRFLRYIDLHKKLLSLFSEMDWKVPMDYRDSVDRLFLGYVRRNLLRAHIPKGEEKEVIRSIAKNGYLKEVLGRYSVNEMQLKLRVFYWLLSKKYISGILLFRNLI